MSVDELMHQIELAFADVPQPDTGDIAPHRCAECDDLRDDFVVHGRDGITNDLLRKHVWDLALLSDEAKQYYLPVWLLASLKDPESDATDSLLTALDSEHRWSPARGYTRKQQRVINAWLEFIASGSEVVAAERASEVWLRRNNAA